MPLQSVHSYRLNEVTATGVVESVIFDMSAHVYVKLYNPPVTGPGTYALFKFDSTIPATSDGDDCSAYVHVLPPYPAGVVNVDAIRRDGNYIVVDLS